MSARRIVTARDLILGIVAAWESQYPEILDPKDTHWPRQREIWIELQKLDKTKATAEEVARVINGGRETGNGRGWVTLECDACCAEVHALIEIDLDLLDDGDGCKASLCLECVTEAAKTLASAMGASS